MTLISPHIWRAYDIRGNATTELTPAVVKKIGRGLVEMLRPFNVQRIAVGRDCRLSGPSLQNAFIEGLVSGGIDVTNIGAVPTPVLYFAVEGLGYDAGVILTASHNPPEDNGLKIRVQGVNILSDDIQRWKALSEKSYPDNELGQIENVDISDVYIRALSDQSISAVNLRIGIDAGSGIMGPTSVRLFKKIGATVYPLYCEPDGHFPHHPADPTKEKNLRDLQALVIAEQLDVGFAFDGDGDRIGVVTRSGQMIWGDILMALFAQELLRHNRGTIVQDVKCSMMLSDVVHAAGGSIVTSATGYALVQKAMKENFALFGGEQSSHLSFSDRYFGFDDGLYAAIRLLPIIHELDERISVLPQYFSTPELRIPVPESDKLGLMATLKILVTGMRIITVDGLRPEDEHGWALIRPSNTEAVITVRVEAKSNDEFNVWKRRVYDWLSQSGVSKDRLEVLL